MVHDIVLKVNPEKSHILTNYAQEIQINIMEWPSPTVNVKISAQQTFTCSYSTIETLEKGVKYIQSSL